MEFLSLAFLDKPVWMWLGFIGLVLALIAFDLGVLHRNPHVIGARESLLMSAFYIGLGLAFGGWVWVSLGEASAMAYLTGFVVEKSLAMDNVLVIAVIFSYFSVPREHQHRVLVWGILGVIVLRAVMIGAGSALVTQFEWVLYLFAAFLVFTGAKMLVGGDTPYEVGRNPVIAFLRRRLPVTETPHGDRFFVRLPRSGTGRSGTGSPVWHVTPLFLALVTVEMADVVFAVDSIPAIFAITTDPYIVYTSNIFAILGLRALYFALAAMIHRFVYLGPALAVVLIFIGGKIFVAEVFGLTKIPPVWSLSITVTILGAGVIGSLWRTRAAPSRNRDRRPVTSESPR